MYLSGKSEKTVVNPSNNCIILGISTLKGSIFEDTEGKGLLYYKYKLPILMSIKL